MQLLPLAFWALCRLRSKLSLLSRTRAYGLWQLAGPHHTRPRHNGWRWAVQVEGPCSAAWPAFSARPVCGRAFPVPVPPLPPCAALGRTVGGRAAQGVCIGSTEAIFPHVWSLLIRAAGCKTDCGRSGTGYCIAPYLRPPRGAAGPGWVTDGAGRGGAGAPSPSVRPGRLGAASGRMADAPPWSRGHRRSCRWGRVAEGPVPVRRPWAARLDPYHYVLGRVRVAAAGPGAQGDCNLGK